MSVTERDTVGIDPSVVEDLIAKETAALDVKHAETLRYREVAREHLPGGVSSSWQTWPPHPIYVDRGQGSHVWDIDGNEYVDLHNGYGVMVVGHAHPKIVEAVKKRIDLGSHFAQPTEDALIVADNLAERTGLPMWRFGNSGTEATLDATRLMRAATGRDRLLKCVGHYHGHHDAPRHAPARVHRLLGHARRRVIAGEGPLRLQQPDHERPPVRPALRVGGDAREEKPHRLLRRDDQHGADDGEDADDVDGDAEIVETGHQTDPDMVDRRV